MNHFAKDYQLTSAEVLRFAIPSTLFSVLRHGYRAVGPILDPTCLDRGSSGNRFIDFRFDSLCRTLRHDFRGGGTTHRKGNRGR